MNELTVITAIIGLTITNVVQSYLNYKIKVNLELLARSGNAKEFAEYKEIVEPVKIKEVKLPTPDIIERDLF